MTHPGPWRRGLAAACAALALAGGAAALFVSSAAAAAPEAATPAVPAAAPAAPDCPPLPQPPSAEQLQAGVRAARDRGLLWRLAKDGRVSWLYGTLHVGKLAWAFPGPQITQALRAVDTLALELVLTDPAVAAAMERSLAAIAQRDAAHPPPAPLQARIGALARADCVDNPALAAQPALLQALTLMVLSGRRDGLDPAFGQEFALDGFARASGLALVSLETPETQLALLLPDDPDARLPTLQRAVAQLESGQARRQLGVLAGLWERGDLDQLADPSRWCECQPGDADMADLLRLNDGRNPALADAISALHGRGQRVFAAVGALHMTGAKALPRLLAERGFVVQRVALDRR